MFATPVRHAAKMPGFWSRSWTELGRQTRIATSFEALTVPKRPLYLVQFDQETKIDRCKLMSDKTAFNGFSEASLTWVPGHTISAAKEVETDAGEQSDEEPAHALFKGNINTDLPPNKPDVQRSGFAAWRTHDRGVSLFGRLLYDVDPYSFLALRVKSDGRKYFVNIQTESIVPTDIHQHLLPCFNPGEWETIIIPFKAFVRTNYGMVVEPQREMMRQKVRTIGIGLTDRVQGPFELRIAEIWATNEPPPRKTDSGFGVEKEEEKKDSMLWDEKKPKDDEPEKILI